MKTKFSGKVWKFGHNVDTDSILPGKFLTLSKPKELAKHAFEIANPLFSKEVEGGDIVLAGRNFGCGSSREHAAIAIKASGVPIVIAESFARIFYRNAINIGLPLVECKDLHERLGQGERIEVDIKKGVIKTKLGPFKVRPLPKNILEILEAGGLVNKLKTDLTRKRGASAH